MAFAIVDGADKSKISYTNGVSRIENLDWTGNGSSVHKIIGASNHSDQERATNDYYATDPVAAELLCDQFTFNHRIWECACGEGHLSEVFKKRGYDVISSDLIDRGYGAGGIDFLNCNKPFNGDIITNPPYKYAQQFVEKALDLIPNGNHVAMFLKLTFLEGKARRALFNNSPPRYLFVSSSRLICAKNGDFKHTDSSAVAYGWYIWEKGFNGEPTIRWFN